LRRPPVGMGQHPELGGNWENLQIVVGEEAGITATWAVSGRQLNKQLVDQPITGGVIKDGMLGAGQPHCPNATTACTPRAARSDGKRWNRAVEKHAGGTAG